jgi:hypothetical protein
VLTHVSCVPTAASDTPSTSPLAETVSIGPFFVIVTFTAAGSAQHTCDIAKMNAIALNRR